MTQLEEAEQEIYSILEFHYGGEPSRACAKELVELVYQMMEKARKSDQEPQGEGDPE